MAGPKRKVFWYFHFRTQTVSENLPTAPRFIRPSDTRPQFANLSRVQVGHGQVTLSFANQDDVPGHGSMITELANVTLTPTHAKRLAIYFTEWLRHYEEKYGKISPDPSEPLDASKVTERANARIANWDAALA